MHVNGEPIKPHAPCIMCVLLQCYEHKFTIALSLSLLSTITLSLVFLQVVCYMVNDLSLSLSIAHTHRPLSCSLAGCPLWHTSSLSLVPFLALFFATTLTNTTRIN